MSYVSYDQLLYFVAVVEQGGFQAAARHLRVSQPSVSAAVRKLEKNYGFRLFHRDTYRPVVSRKGETIYRHAKIALSQMEKLNDVAHVLAMDRETRVSVAVGDLCPLERALAVMRQFFTKKQECQLVVHYEGVRGAVEKVLDKQVDFAISTIPEDLLERFETIQLLQTQLVPVVHHDHPLAGHNHNVAEHDLNAHVQVIIRDTAQRLESKDFGIATGQLARCTVADQSMKKSLIMAGMGWGRLPDFLIQQELARGELVVLKTTAVSSPRLSVYAFRLKDRVFGPVTEAIWEYLQQHVDLSE